MTAGVVVARFCAIRSVPSRGVTVLSMDLPLDRAATALDRLGTPILGETIHVGFTRLQNDGEEGEPPPPLHGTFEKFATISGREALNLSIEVPMEQAHHVMKTLGMPTRSSDIRVAIARLLQAPERRARPSKTPGELAVQRAALRVKEEPFQRFILGTDFVAGDAMGNELETTAALRTQLGIESRRVLRENHEKLREYWAMEARYEDWMQNGGLEISVARDAR